MRKKESMSQECPCIHLFPSCPQIECLVFLKTGFVVSTSNASNWRYRWSSLWFSWYLICRLLFLWCIWALMSIIALVDLTIWARLFTPELFLSHGLQLVHLNVIFKCSWDVDAWRHTDNRLDCWFRRQVIRLPILLHLQLSQSILHLKIHVKLPSPKGLQNLSPLHLPVLDQFCEVELLSVYMCNLQLAGNVHQVLWTTIFLTKETSWSICFCCS